MTLTFCTGVHVHTHLSFWQISVLLHLCKSLFRGGKNPTLLGNDSKYKEIDLSTTAELGKFAENVHTRQKSKSEMHEDKVFFHLNSQLFPQFASSGPEPAMTR